MGLTELAVPGVSVSSFGKGVNAAETPGLAAAERSELVRRGRVRGGDIMPCSRILLISFMPCPEVNWRTGSSEPVRDGPNSACTLAYGQENVGIVSVTKSRGDAGMDQPRSRGEPKTETRCETSWQAMGPRCCGWSLVQELAPRRPVMRSARRAWRNEER